MIDPHYIKIATGFFCLLNPFVLIPVFLSLTSGMTRAQRMKTALTTAVSIFIIMAIAIFTGNQVLELFGITVNDFRIAGGILIMLMSISMVQAKEKEHRYTKKEHEEAKEKSADDNIAVVPLAIPLMAGPASISVAIIEAGICNTVLSRSILMAIIAGLCVVLWIAMILGERIGRFLGHTGQQVLSRIMGLILLALSVEFLITGIKNAFGI